MSTTLSFHRHHQTQRFAAKFGDAARTLTLKIRRQVMQMPLKRSFMSDERGGPLVEMAVLLLPFLLMVAIVIEGGNLFWRHQISLKAVRDTARYVSRTPLLFDEVCGLDGNVLAATTASAKLLGVTGSLEGGPPLVPNWTLANIDIPTPVVLRADPCLAVVQAIAEVELPLPFAPILQLVQPSLDDNFSFSVADQARWLGE